MLTEAILLDISQAERQIAELERELDRLQQPIRVPVDIEGERAVAELRQDVAGADAGFADLNAELAETDRELDRVRDSADRAGRELETTGRRGVSSFNGMAVAAGAFGVALAAAVGVRAFVGFADQAIDAASDFEESLSKSRVVFGQFSDEIEEFATTGPRALGLANREALAFTATFGNLFVALGLSQQAAAELSPQIVQLGADLASFNNIDVADALEKLRSGLVGEAEPLRALGVNINETVVAAKALELGLGGVNGELTEAEKVQARYALILEQTVTAQGDFARTADGIANRQRTLTAEWENAQQAIGEALLPAFESLLDIAPDVIASLEDLAPVIQSIAASVAATDFSGFVGGLADILRALASAPGIATAFFSGFVNEDAEQGLLAVSRLTQGFVELLREGEDPAKALLNTLTQLTQKDLDPEQFSEVAQFFIDMAGLDTRRTIDVLRQLRTSGPQLGLTAEVIAQIAEALALVNTSSEGRRGRGGGGLPDFLTDVGTAAGAAIPPLTEVASAILAAAAAGESLEQFAPTVGIQDWITDLESVTGAVSAVGDALKTEGDEALENLRGFLDDLDQEFSRREDFAANLAILRQRGLTELADALEDAGLDAAQVAADAVNDPTIANEANQRFVEHNKEMARLGLVAFDTELKQLVLGIEPPAVVIPLTFGGLPDIPISAITAGGIIPAPGGGQQVTVNNNFFTEPSPTTDTQRISQSVSNITRGTIGSGIG